MILSVIGFIAVMLTIAMFATRQMMLGFACVMFWAIFGGYAYTLSTATWDIYYLIFFAGAFGMTTFTAISAFALRERKDNKTDKGEYIDEGKGEDERYLDDEPDRADDLSNDVDISERTRAVRERAEARRKFSGRNR